MINIIEQNGKSSYNVINYIIDSTDDLENLPTNIASGSTALIATGITTDIYILNNQKEWVKL